VEDDITKVQSCKSYNGTMTDFCQYVNLDCLLTIETGEGEGAPKCVIKVRRHISKSSINASIYV
jgi:hypothetical protein